MSNGFGNVIAIPSVKKAGDLLVSTDSGVIWSDGQGGGGIVTALDLKVDKDSVVAAASRLVQNKLLAGDAQPAFSINGLGTVSWGEGGATAPDTQLYRYGVNTMRMSGSLWTGGAIVSEGNLLYLGSALDAVLARDGIGVIRTDGNFKINGAGGLIFGSAADTSLYRSGLNTLKTDGNLVVSGYAEVNHAWGLSLKHDNSLGIRFGTASDVNLYRWGADRLATNDLFMVDRLSLTDSALGFYKPGDTQFRFLAEIGGIFRWSDGSAFDTTLYRIASGLLKTDGGFHAGGALTAGAGSAYQVEIGYVDGFAGLKFGSASDTKLYRASAGWLTTPTNFWTQGLIYLGGSADAMIYRYAGNKVASIGSFVSDGALAGWGFETHATGESFPRVLLRNDAILQFGPGDAGFDTNLYRVGIGLLATDSAFRVFRASSTSEAFSTQIGGSIYITIRQDGKITWSGEALTNLYRSAAGWLSTDGSLAVGGILNVLTPGGSAGFTSIGVNPSGVGARTIEVGGENSAGANYRALRVGN